MGGVCQKPLENTAAPTVCRWHGLSRTLVSIIERQRVGRWAGFHGEPLAVREPAAKLIVDERESFEGGSQPPPRCSTVLIQFRHAAVCALQRVKSI
jgi:hypothetical protein